MSSNETAPCTVRHSEAVVRFCDESSLLINFITGVSEMAGTLDEIGAITVTALRTFGVRSTDAQHQIKHAEHGFGARAKLGTYWQLMLQTVLCRAIDNTLIYVSDLLTLIFTTRPETLRSNETVTLEFILKHKDQEELINALAERKVNKLSYQGMKDLARYVADTLGLDMFSGPEELNKAIRLNEMRNLIVHNRGIVNKTFLSRVPDSRLSLGDRVTLDFKELVDDMMFLINVVHDMEMRAIAKFRIIPQDETPTGT